MNQKIQSRDINLFAVGQIVTVPNIEDFKKTKILTINDSGVTVSSNGYPHTVISGKTPAIPFVEETEVVNDIKGVGVDIENVIKLTSKENNENCNNHLAGGRAKRGSLTKKMKSIVLPNKDKFTIADLAELNGIPNNYANTYVKDHLNKTIVEAGKADKKEGQRGKTASLYSKK